MDEEKSVGHTVCYNSVPECDTSGAESQGRAGEDCHCQQTGENSCVEHRVGMCLEEQDLEQDSDNVSEEQLSGYEWEEQRHSESDQNCYGDLSSFRSGSTVNLDFLVQSPPQMTC